MLLVSDLHFGPKLPSGATRQILKAAERNPDKIVVIPGDLTHFSREHEYLAAEEFIRALIAQGNTVIMTPGNHDLGGWFAEKFSLMGWSGQYDVAIERVISMHAPVLAQKGVLAVREDRLDSITQVDSHIFVCLRSEHRALARIRKDQIAWASSVLETLDLTGKSLHLVCHHSLWKDLSDRHFPMAARTRLEVNLLQRFNFCSVIHGHNHRFTYQETTSPNIGYSIKRISCPTICTRNGKQARGFLYWHHPSEPALENVDLYPEEEPDGCD